jgi:hypothetical protein
VLISDSSNGRGIELGIQKIHSKRGTTTQANNLISKEGYLGQSGLSAIISRTRIRTLGAISGKLRRYLNWVEGNQGWLNISHELFYRVCSEYSRITMEVGSFPGSHFMAGR